jgi:hypothetical protein
LAGRARKHLAAETHAVSLAVDYELEAGDEPLAGRLAVEVSWGLRGGDGVDAWLDVEGRRIGFGSRGTVHAASGYRAEVPTAGVRLAADIAPDAELWHYPVEAVTSSDAGFERSYQGTAVVTVWSVDLPAGGRWRGRLRLSRPAS